jgi:hypothetical protein
MVLQRKSTYKAPIIPPQP